MATYTEQLELAEASLSREAETLRLAYKTWADQTRLVDGIASEVRDLKRRVREEAQDKGDRQ